MNSEPDDRRLRQLFAGSKAQDALHAPAFDEIARGRRTAPRTAIRWARVAAAAAVIVLLGASVLLLGRRSAAHSEAKPTQLASTAGTTASESAAKLAPWQALFEWRAATDSLLPSSSWLGAGQTAPSDSLINSVSGETDSTSQSGKEAL